MASQSPAVEREAKQEQRDLMFHVAQKPPSELDAAPDPQASTSIRPDGPPRNCNDSPPSRREISQEALNPALQYSFKRSQRVPFIKGGRGLLFNQREEWPPNRDRSRYAQRTEVTKEESGQATVDGQSRECRRREGRQTLSQTPQG